MKFNDIVEMNEKELNLKLAELKSELLNLRFQLEINQLDNPMRIKEVKKNIAQIKTVIRQRQLSAVSEQEDQNMSERTTHRKTRVGMVISDKMDKTIVVAVVDSVKHPLYNKVVKRTYKLKAHDEQNTCQIGDKVKVMETRPLSKDKRWRLVEIIEKAK